MGNGIDVLRACLSPRVFSDHETEIDAMRVGMREREPRLQETWANERRRVLEMSHVSLLGFCAICG